MSSSDTTGVVSPSKLLSSKTDTADAVDDEADETEPTEDTFLEEENPASGEGLLTDEQKDYEDEEEDTTNLKKKFVTVYKGRKYNWQSKVNLHIHIIEHLNMDCMEVIAFNTSTMVEAPHVFVSTQHIQDKVGPLQSYEGITSVVNEYYKLKMQPPDVAEIKTMFLRVLMTNYILERVTVNLGDRLKPVFLIDIKDFNKVPKLTKTEIDALNEQKGHRTTTIDNNRVSLNPTEDIVFTNSFVMARPDHVFESKVKRYGKSATLVGDVVDEVSSKKRDVLQKLVKAQTTPTLPSRAKTIMNNLQSLKKGKKGRNTLRITTFSGFQKFRNDTDLLIESLSFIHISERMEFQVVCKKWHQVLAYAVKTANYMHICTRDIYYYGSIAENEEPHPYPNAGNRRTPVDAAEMTYNEKMQYQHPVVLRKIFVNPIMTVKLLKLCAKTLHHLKLNYCVVNHAVKKCINTLLGDKLISLSIGVIKMDDSVEPIPQPIISPPPSTRGGIFAPTASSVGGRGGDQTSQKKDAKNVSTALVVPDSPMAKAGASSVKNSRSIFTYDSKSAAPSPPLTPGANSSRIHTPTDGKISIAAAAASALKDNKVGNPLIIDVEEVIDKTEEELEEEKRVPYFTMRYMNGDDVFELIQNCGSALTHLELNTLIGDLPEDFFKYTPKLISLSAIDSSICMAPVRSVRDDIAGSTRLHALAGGLEGVRMADLLQMIADSPEEAIVLTDKKGNIVITSEGWNRLTGYTIEEVQGITLDFLRGTFTDDTEFDTIMDSFHFQAQAVQCCCYCYRKDDLAFLCQICVIPNVAKHPGPVLGGNSLSAEFLAQLALEEQEREEEKKAALKNGNVQNFADISSWQPSKREHRYHLVRFGLLSNPFDPAAMAEQFKTRAKKIGSAPGYDN